MNFSFKKSDQSKLRIFLFIKIDRKFRFRDFRVDECRWPGLQSHCSILIHFWLQIELVRMRNYVAYTVIRCLHFYLGNYFFFWVWNHQISVVFFWLFHFCSLDSVLICVVYNYLRVGLHVSWPVGFTSTIPCLPFFFQLFFAFLLHFCCQNTYFHTFCFLQVFLGETCEFFRAFWQKN